MTQSIPPRFITPQSIKPQAITPLAYLRQEMRKKQLDYYLLGSSDPHNSEYVPEHWRYLAKVSGFNGSLGYLLVAAEDFAGLWVDSRYHIQAERECPPEIQIFRIGQPGVPQLHQFWEQTLNKTKQVLRLGFDQRCFSRWSLRNLLSSGHKCELDGTSLSIDQVSPKKATEEPQTSVYSYALEYCGQSRAEKVQQVRRLMQCDYYPITMLDSIAWLLNIRADDIAYNPVAISYILLGRKSLCWYIQRKRISSELWNELHSELPELQIKGYECFYDDYHQLSSTNLLLTEQSNLSLFSSKQTKLSRDIITDLKAIKNHTEQEQLRKIMALDGAAICAFHTWLRPLVTARLIDARLVPAALVSVPPETDEYQLGQRLIQLRKEVAGALGESFAPIVGFGPNSALPHYCALSPEDSHKIEDNGWLLIDSGGQYLGGTTDMTRCFPLQFGKAPQELRHIYTLVLKGHLQLQNARFPRGTLGVQLDTLARQPLWSEGKNYQHGTGHGVGNFLNVHEGPISISPTPLNEALKPGMLVSNEPGYYRKGAFGMRIENLLLVQEQDREWLYFEPMTLFPYEREMLDRDILSPQEIKWIDNYHARCLERILATQKLKPEQEAWLRMRCAQLGDKI